MSDDEAGFLYSWERIVLAARISSTAKLVAFAMRTHADPDGSRVRPSTARLSILCGLSYASVRRARQDLVRGGLLELTRRGNRRRHQADEYRIILADDVLDRLKWLSPSEITEAADKLNEQRQAAEATRRRTKDQGSHTDPEPDDQGSQTHPETSIRAHTQPGSGLTDVPPPTQGDQATKETNSEVGNVTSQTGARDDEPILINGGGGEIETAPVCGRCEAILDPDGSCFVCRTARSAS